MLSHNNQISQSRKAEFLKMIALLLIHSSGLNLYNNIVGGNKCEVIIADQKYQLPLIHWYKNLVIHP
jgi:hypothetical protein